MTFSYSKLLFFLVLAWSIFGDVFTFVGVGLARVLLGINPNQNDYILFELGLTLHVVAVVGGLTVILTNAIVLPIQSIRKKRIISHVNNRDIGVLTNDQQISFALGVNGLGVGFWLTF